MRALRPAVVLEIGFGAGQSAFNFLQGLPPGSRLYSFDIGPDSERIARRSFPHHPSFRFARKSQVEISGADVDRQPVDLVFLDAAHDLALNQQTFERVVELMSSDALLLVHDTGTWHRSAFASAHARAASEQARHWIGPDEYQHRPDERDFVNWVLERHPEFLPAPHPHHAHPSSRADPDAAQPGAAHRHGGRPGLRWTPMSRVG